MKLLLVALSALLSQQTIFSMETIPAIGTLENYLKPGTQIIASFETALPSLSGKHYYFRGEIIEEGRSILILQPVNLDGPCLKIDRTGHKTTITHDGQFAIVE